MKARDLLAETCSSLAANKVRTGLTMLGIVIGIASVIAMVSIGRGAQDSIQSSIEGLGSHMLTVAPGLMQPGRGFVSSGRGSSQSVKSEDAEAIRGLAGVAFVSGELQRRFQVASQVGTNTNVTVIGAGPDYEPVHNAAVERGSFITGGHERSMSRVAVLGPTTAADLFGEDEAVGKTIRINRVNFKVIGVFKSKGGSGFFNPDDIVLVPLATMQKILAGSDYLSSVAVAAADKDDMAAVKEQVTALLMARHKVAEPDFSVVSQADILGALSQVTATFTMFLASIAGISLVVGGIGIMNMMLTAVTERTREIGLRKAIGAKSRFIALQFLAESVMLTFLGGAAGIMLGWLAATLVSRLAGIATKVSPESVLLAFGVSAAIGIAFGYYPARRAAGLHPIEALRYE